MAPHSYLLTPVLDAKSYLDWAIRIATTGSLGESVFHQAPGYPILVAGFFSVVGIYPIAWIFVQNVIGALASVLTYFIALRIFTLRTAWIAAFGMAIYPVLIPFDQVFEKTTLSVFLGTSLLAATLYLDSKKPRTLEYFGVGVLFGLAILVRETYLLFLLFTLFWLAKKTKWFLLPLLLGAATAIAPITAHNYLSAHDWVLITNQSGANFYVGNNPSADGTDRRPKEMGLRRSPEFEALDFQRRSEEISGKRLLPSESSHFWWEEGMKYFRSQPVNALHGWLRKGLLTVSNTEIPDNYDHATFREESRFLRWNPLSFAFIFAFAVISFAFMPWNRNVILVIGFLLIQFVSLIVFHTNSRYRMDLVPPLTILAAYGGLRLYELRQDRRRLILGTLFGGFGLTISLLPLYEVDRSEREYRTALFLISDQKLEEAKAHLEKCLGITPDHSYCSGALGYIWLERGNPKEALPHLQRAVDLDPNDVQAWNNLGSAFGRLEKFDEAKTAFRRALQIDPENKLAREGSSLAAQSVIGKQSQAGVIQR